MKYNRYGILLLAIVTMIPLCLTACHTAETTSNASESVTTTTTTTEPLLDIDISQLLTSEQVGSAIGVPVGEATIYDEGTVANYTSKDVLSSAEISMKKCERAIYDVTVANIADATDAPNLGEAAKWSANAKQLILYGKGYMIGIAVNVKDMNNDDSLVAARQLAVLILEKLG